MSFIFKIILLSCLCTCVFAQTETRSSTVTSTTGAPANPANNNGESTTYTTTTTTSTTVNPDDSIVSAVYDKFHKNPALIGTSLTVTSLNGIVTINGTVTAQAQADAAIADAKTIVGVNSVRSNIKVTTNPDLTSPAPSTNY
jgi:osmotically-inducible protein OsmY